MQNDRNQIWVDFLKVVALLALAGLVLCDIIVVRRSRDSIKRSADATVSELENRLKDLENARAEAEKAFRERLAAADARYRDAKAKAEKLAEKNERTVEAYEQKLQEAEGKYGEELEKLTASFESKIRDLNGNLEPPNAVAASPRQSRLSVADETDQTPRESSKARDTERSSKMVRCDRCGGKGEIQRKYTCDYCGGSGRLKETHVLNKNYGYGWYSRNSEKLSTMYHDCPHCLPGAFKGGGSKGYSIVTEICPKCAGKGRVERE